NLRQFGDHRVAALLEPGVASGRIHQRHRREVMTGGVAAQLDVWSLPAAKRRGSSRQARGETKRMQQAVLIELEQVGLVAEHRVFERAVEQPHCGQRKRARQQRHAVNGARLRSMRSSERVELRTSSDELRAMNYEYEVPQIAVASIQILEISFS